MIYAISLILAYLLGAIPAAYYAGKWARGIDLRREGSGNVGFTNAWRVLGWKWSLPVLLVDIGKGFAAAALAWLLAADDQWLPILNGLLAILGHTWTVFLGFHGGGKGVATSAGVFMALLPLPFVIALGVFLAILALTRFMSVASITGAVTLFVSAGVLYMLNNEYAPTLQVLTFSFLVACFIVIKHHSNIRRLLKGAEPKLGTHHQEEASNNNGNHTGN